MKNKIAQYKRVSTLEQKTDRQDSILFGVKVYEDKCSGTVAFSDRTLAKELLADIDKGLINEVHVHSIDRLGRNTLNIMQTIQDLTSKGVNVVSVKEGLSTLNADGTENLISKMMVGILGTLAEFELNRMKERQREGIASAKIKGNYKGNGRPSGTLEDIDSFMKKSSSKKVIKHLKEGNSLRRTAKLADCSVTLVQKVKSYLEESSNLNAETIEHISYIKD
jgi:DNA invertase Pin-like site-specific DNA recombinase